LGKQSQCEKQGQKEGEICFHSLDELVNGFMMVWLVFLALPFYQLLLF